MKGKRRYACTLGTDNEVKFTVGKERCVCKSERDKNIFNFRNLITTVLFDR